MARRYLAGVIAGAVAMLAIVPPVTGGGPQLLSLHVLSQMLLLAVAAPLLVYALAPLAEGVRWHPAIGLLALNLVFFGWLFPTVVDTVNRSPLLNATAHLVFLMAAMSFWWPVMRPDGMSRIAKVGYLLIAGVPPTIPGVLLGFSHRVLYASYATAGFGPALEDQQLAGLLLFGSAKLVLLTVTFVTLWRMLAPEAEPPDDEGSRESVPDLPPTAPVWLSRLDEVLPAEPAPASRRLLLPH